MNRSEANEKARQHISNAGFGTGTNITTHALKCMMVDFYLDNQVKNLGIANVSGMLPLTENAKSKLEYINGSCIARDFPKEQPTKQWAGAVLDLLEELGLGNYR